MTIDKVLVRIREQMDLEAETEHEVLEEIRTHLEDAAVAARSQGLDAQAALSEAAARFGVEDVGTALQNTHAGWGTADGVAAAALPVILTLILRWVVFAPAGAVSGWQQILSRPVFWGIAVVALLVPLLRFPRWRYALVSWAVFWSLSVVFVVWPALRW